MTKVLGSKIVSREASHQPGFGGSCTWTGASLSKAGFYPIHRDLSIELTGGVTKARFLRAINGDPDARPVRGLGEIAVVSVGPATILEVWERNELLEIDVDEVANPAAAEKTAARFALARP